MFNRIYSDRKRLLRDYKNKLDSEKFDHERIVKLDEEIESLIQQERALFFNNKKLVSKLTKLQAERTTLMAELTKQDTSMARTLELEAILESQGGTILEFSEDLYTAISNYIK